LVWPLCGAALLAWSSQDVVAWCALGAGLAAQALPLLLWGLGLAQHVAAVVARLGLGVLALQSELLLVVQGRFALKSCGSQALWWQALWQRVPLLRARAWLSL
jgi:hypothetical protein